MTHFNFHHSPLTYAHWSECALTECGLAITPELIAEALKEYWENHAKGNVGHTKVHLPLDESATGGRTEGALIGFYRDYSGTKDIYRGPTSPISRPARSVDMFLRDRQTGRRLLSLEGVSISNGQTAWFAVECIDLLLPNNRDISVALLGAGHLALAVVLALNCRASDRITGISIISLSTSNRVFVDAVQPKVNICLNAAVNRDTIRAANVIITATNLRQPVIASHEIGPTAVTVALGRNELPPDYFDRIIREKSPNIVDDIEAVEKRDVDAVARFYSMKGERLTVEGKRDGVKCITDVFFDTQFRLDCRHGGPATICSVGLASLDICVAAYIYERLIERFSVQEYGTTAFYGPPSTIPNRILHLREGMKQANLDAILLFIPKNSFFLTGFNPTIYSSPVISILTERSLEPMLLINVLRYENAKATPGWRTIFTYRNWFGAMTHGDTWPIAIANILPRAGKRIGLENEISVAHQRRLAESLPDVEFVYISGMIQDCRNMKDEDEIANAWIAAELCNAAMNAIECSLATVATEQDAVQAAWNAGYNLWVTKYKEGNINGFGSLEGGDLYGLKPWVMAGQRRFLQVNKPTNTPICDMAVSAYVWSCFNGMHAELKRTICVGKVTAAQHDALSLVSQIHNEVSALLKPGVAINEIYKVACWQLEEHGYALPGHVGHGIGYGAHEKLSIDGHTETILVTGMMLTFEPNIEEREKNVTTQISDMIIINDDGYEFLAPYRNDPISSAR